MNWLTDIFTEQTFLQAALVLSLISAAGLALGKVRIFGISLGITFVFFAGIIAGHFGLAVNPDMLSTIQNFGLILFIYALGVQVGPGFFSSFKHGGIKLNLLALLLMIVGSLMAVILHWTTDTSIGDMMGLLSGAVTNTPMLGAAQQALLQVEPDNIAGANNMAMACAVGYPFGLIGVILCVVILKKTSGAGKEEKLAGQIVPAKTVKAEQAKNTASPDLDSSRYGVMVKRESASPLSDELTLHRQTHLLSLDNVPEEKQEKKDTVSDSLRISPEERKSWNESPESKKESGKKKKLAALLMALLMLIGGGIFIGVKTQ